MQNKTVETEQSQEGSFKTFFFSSNRFRYIREQAQYIIMCYSSKSSPKSSSKSRPLFIICQAKAPCLVMPRCDQIELINMIIGVIIE